MPALSSVDRMLRTARKMHPELWERTDQVARIISPECFEEGWTIVEPAAARRLHESRMKLQRATAIRKAHDVLTFLGVNTETDWYELLTHMAEED